MEFVRTDQPDTWRNYPAPPLPEWAAAELVTIGGLNQFGEPNLIFAWGQSYETYRMNRMRLLHVDTRIPAIEHKRYTFKKLLYEVPEKVFLGTDAATGEMRFRDEMVKKYDTITLDHAPGEGDIIPPGYFFDQEYPEMEWIGEQLWFVMQFIPPEHILGGREVWEKERFDKGTNPDTGVDEIVDFLGPFPSEGRYQDVHVVGQPCEYIEEIEEPVIVQEGWQLVRRRMFDGSLRTIKEPRLRYTGEAQKIPKIRKHLAYCEPSEETFTALREAWDRRNNLDVKQLKSAVKFYEYNRLIQKRCKEQREENAKGVADMVSTLRRMGDDSVDYEKKLQGDGSRIGNDRMGRKLMNRKMRRIQESKQRRGRIAA